MMTASQKVSTPKMTLAASAPRAIVSGRPIPSRRSGTEISRRSAPKSMREASAKSTSVSVASASARTAPLSIPRSSQPSTSVPNKRPAATNSIGPVRTVRSRRLDSPA